AHGLEQRGATGDAARGHDFGLLLFERIEFVEDARRLEAQRGTGLARSPYVHQPMDDVLLQLETEFVAGRAWVGDGAPGEAPAPVTDDGLDGAEQLGGSHDGDRDARPPEDRLQDFAVAVAGDDHPILDGVAADDAAGRNAEAEDGVAGGGELMDEL